VTVDWTWPAIAPVCPMIGLESKWSMPPFPGPPASGRTLSVRLMNTVGRPAALICTTAAFTLGLPHHGPARHASHAPHRPATEGSQRMVRRTGGNRSRSRRSAPWRAGLIRGRFSPKAGGLPRPSRAPSFVGVSQL
jgi:hypothetical protein